MAEAKYGKYIKRGTAGKGSGPEIPGVTLAVLESPDDWKGIQHRINWGYVSQPFLVEEPHSHDFDEFLCFLGCNPADPKDFGAEIEISLGKDGEKQIVDTATVVCIPKGLIHCPINFKKIDKPILFGYIYMSPEYTQKPVS